MKDEKKKTVKKKTVKKTAEEKKTMRKGLKCSHCGGFDTMVIHQIMGRIGGTRIINRCESCNLCFTVFEEKLKKNKK